MRKSRARAKGRTRDRTTSGIAEFPSRPVLEHFENAGELPGSRVLGLLGPNLTHVPRPQQHERPQRSRGPPLARAPARLPRFLVIASSVAVPVGSKAGSGSEVPRGKSTSWAATISSYDAWTNTAATGSNQTHRQSGLVSMRGATVGVSFARSTRTAGRPICVELRDHPGASSAAIRLWRSHVALEEVGPDHFQPGVGEDLAARPEVILISEAWPMWKPRNRSGIPGPPANLTASCGYQSGCSPRPIVRPRRAAS